MTRFKPLGDVARWRTLYDLLRSRNVDDVVTYEQMAKVLQLHQMRDRAKIRTAFRRAASEFEQENSRAVEVVANTGYRIVEPDEQLRLAKLHHRRAGKSLERGHSKVTHVDLNGMDPAMRRLFEVQARMFATLLDYNRRLDTRQDRLETVLDGMTTRTERTEGEIAELKARLARLETEHGDIA